MAIKLSIDLSDATFAELSAVIGYAHQLGVDADEKLTFEGTVLNIEFDGDLSLMMFLMPLMRRKLSSTTLAKTAPSTQMI